MEITFYRKLADRVSDAVISNNEYTVSEAKKIKYGLVCIFSDLYKFLLMLIIFSLFSATLEYLTAFMAVLLLRPILGGYHAKSEVACIFVSFFTMATSVIFGKMNILPGFVQIALIIVLPLTGMAIAPVRTTKADEKTGVYKVLAFLVTPVLLLLDFFFIPAQILQISVIIIYLLAMFQLIKNKLFLGI